MVGGLHDEGVDGLDVRMLFPEQRNTLSNKCSDSSMEVKIPALLRNYDRPGFMEVSFTFNKTLNWFLTLDY